MPVPNVKEFTILINHSLKLVWQLHNNHAVTTDTAYDCPTWQLMNTFGGLRGGVVGMGRLIQS